MLRKLSIVSGAFLAAILLVASISLASGLVLSQGRLKAAIIDGFLSGALFHFDRWVECTGLVMQYSRHENFVLNAIDTRWRNPGHHSCDELIVLLEGPPYRIAIAPAASYVSYAAGARHLQALALRVMRLSTTMSVYRLLSYASIIALFFAAWRTSPSLAVRVVAPIVGTLIFAFGLRRYGDNTMWAPAFFVGFFTLSVFLVLPRYFSDRGNRVGFFCFLGVLVSYFEYLHGALPVFLSLTIVINHFFYVARSPRARYLDAVREPVTILCCFVLAFILLTVLRLTLLSSLTDQFVWQSFFTGLGSRLSNTAPEVPIIHATDIAAGLWADRREMTGSKTASGILLSAALIAWISTIGLVLLSQLKAPAPSATRELLIGLSVLASAGVGILSWYLLFPNHTVVHTWLMVRMLALPVAYCFIAFILAAGYWHDARRRLSVN
jgi:hypothetical protein